MNKLAQSGIAVLACYGAFSAFQHFATSATAQNYGYNDPQHGLGRRKESNNFTARTNIIDAVNAATDRVGGYANRAQLFGSRNRPIWMVNVVNGGRSNQSRSEVVFVDGNSSRIIRTGRPPQDGNWQNYEDQSQRQEERGKWQNQRGNRGGGNNGNAGENNGGEGENNGGNQGNESGEGDNS